MPLIEDPEKGLSTNDLSKDSDIETPDGTETQFLKPQVEIPKGIKAADFNTFSMETSDKNLKFFVNKMEL